jgi:predicted dithiol-disulfide oxidoreductase (DUF899 family)
MAARKRAKATSKTARRKAPRNPSTKAASRAPKSRSTARFPGESVAYRRARDRLLQAEIGLRREVEAVAALRRRLPLGGAVPVDYVFEEAAVGFGPPQEVTLSQLFARPDASLAIYSFMYGPNMAAPCPSCTSILDALDGEAPHIAQRINFAVVAKSPISRIMDFAEPRGWRHLRLLSSLENSYNRDYHGETADGAQMPCLNVFVKRNGRIHHVWASELLFGKADPGQNHRHVDMIWPLWNMLDFTPEGRGTSWHPKLSYED